MAGLRVDFAAVDEARRRQDEDVVQSPFNGAHGLGATAAGAGVRVVGKDVIDAVAHQRQGLRAKGGDERDVVLVVQPFFFDVVFFFGKVEAAMRAGDAEQAFNALVEVADDGELAS